MRSYQDTHLLYANTRSIAHFSTGVRYEKLFPKMLLSDITRAALDAYRAQWSRDDRHPASAHWDWERLVEQRNADPRQFQLAIWNQQVGQSVSRKNLHALAIGRTSSTGYAVRIEYIESYPKGGNPFRKHVFPIAVTALTYYGFLIDAACMKIMKPLPGVRAYYESQGFQVEKPRSGCFDLVKMLGEDHG